MDERLEAFFGTLYITAIQYALIGWHWLTEATSSCQTRSKNIYKALQDSSKENKYVLLDSNHYPICVKDIAPWCSNKRVYESGKLELHDRLQSSTILRFDCVNVELEYGSNKQILNITPFFMNFQWKQGSEPTLLEVVLLYMMIEDQPTPIRDLQHWTLNILDSNANEHRISLLSEQARRKFNTTWS